MSSLIIETQLEPRCFQKEPEAEKAHAYELSPRGRVIELIQKGGVSHLLMGIPAPVFGMDTVCALWK